MSYWQTFLNYYNNSLVKAGSPRTTLPMLPFGEPGLGDPHSPDQLKLLLNAKSIPDLLNLFDGISRDGSLFRGDDVIIGSSGKGW